MASTSRGARALRTLIGDGFGAQSEAAKRLGVDSGMMSRLVRGERGPSLELALKIRDVYGIDPSLWTQRCREAGAA